MCPLGALLWALVTITSPGHALLYQPRLGYQGHRFSLVKFRSMTADGRRVTSIGRWLRATALDELPQLVNILRGEMSFVGPRPLLATDIEGLSRVPGHVRRVQMIPGLAGLAQLYGGKHPEPTSRLALDLYYAHARSFGFDLWIVCRSIVTSFLGGWEPSAPPRSVLK